MRAELSVQNWSHASRDQALSQVSLQAILLEQVFIHTNCFRQNFFWMWLHISFITALRKLRWGELGVAGWHGLNSDTMAFQAKTKQRKKQANKQTNQKIQTLQKLFPWYWKANSSIEKAHVTYFSGSSFSGENAVLLLTDFYGVPTIFFSLLR